METKTLTLELSIDHINIILAALSEQSYKVVQPVIEVIRQQAAPQLEPKLDDTPLEASDEK